MRDYFELWDMFDNCTDKALLTTAAKKLGEWGRPIPAGDEVKVFNEIEGKLRMGDKKGQVPFHKFCSWAILQKLDNEEVEEDSDEEMCVVPKASAFPQVLQLGNPSKARQ